MRSSRLWSIDLKALSGCYNREGRPFAHLAHIMIKKEEMPCLDLD